MESLILYFNFKKIVKTELDSSASSKIFVYLSSLKLPFESFPIKHFKKEKIRKRRGAKI